jgi:WD40 repeat protein
MSRQSGLLILALVLGSSCRPPAGSRLWIFQRDGYGCSEGASAVVSGGTDNIYAAGSLDSRDGNPVFTVAGLSSSGQERWLYTLDSLSNTTNQHYSFATSICRDPEDNVYAVGSAGREAVVSLTSAGQLRWSRTGPLGFPLDGATIIRGHDGNLYVGGQDDSILAVISLTPDGTERWTYRRPGYDPSALLCGPDGNIYVACATRELGFTVVSLTPDGALRWARGVSAEMHPVAQALAADRDGNIYACGLLDGISVVSFTPDGVQRWTWHRDYSPGAEWGVCGVACDSRGNVLVALYTSFPGDGYPVTHLAVARLSNTGEEQWIYHDPSNNEYARGGIAIAVGPDDNVYCAGSPDAWKAVVLSLDGSGALRWQRAFGCATWGGSSIGGLAFSPDGELLVAGSTTGYFTDGDFTVACFDLAGIE